MPERRDIVDPSVKSTSNSEVKPNFGMSTSGISLYDGGKDSHKKNLTSSIIPHGIKTVMNVDILAGNRIRLRDEDDPSNPSNVKASEESKDKGRDMESDAVMDPAVGSLEHKDYS
ncbi:peptide ABC transporter substrate-binding protein [Sesbania bispinosa]|nr:peptide ABC transporter substrate-binding protein [Sesbania bispinosa]